MYVDRDIDALMERTRHRPLVTGMVSPRAALVFAFALEAGAFVVLWSTSNVLAASLALAATAFYICNYTLWLKRTSRQNIVIGGAAGAVPVLVGWVAVTGSLDWAPVLLFLFIFFWTPPHFWALAIRHVDDYRAASVPMLPVVVSLARTVRTMGAYTLVVFACSMALVPVADMGVIYSIAAFVLGVAFIVVTYRLGEAPTPTAAMRVFSYSISYVTLIGVAITVDVLVR